MNSEPRFADLPVDEQTARLAATLHEHEVDGRFPFPDRGAQLVFDRRCAQLAAKTGRTVDDVVEAVRDAAKAVPDAHRRAEVEEADRLAHDHVSPDGVFDAIGAVSLYVEAFQAGVRHADARRKEVR